MESSHVAGSSRLMPVALDFLSVESCELNTNLHGACHLLSKAVADMLTDVPCTAEPSTSQCIRERAISTSLRRSSALPLLLGKCRRPRSTYVCMLSRRNTPTSSPSTHSSQSLGEVQDPHTFPTKSFSPEYDHPHTSPAASTSLFIPACVAFRD